MLPHIYSLLAVSNWIRLRRLGGFGLVLLGVADNSVVPLTGSMDVLTIWLAARHREPWPYYALMATIGAVLGGYITYSLARKGGRHAMERRLSKRRAAKVYKRFERWGFGAIAIPALLPPPFPFVPFLLAAGAMQYSRLKFLGALALGRGVRYSVAAYLGALYGRHILRFFSRYDKLALGVLIGLAVMGGILTLIQYFRNK
jgi:membrane protein YqaA with SNARE-associated domain